jgi:hypothetical protein
MTAFLEAWLPIANALNDAFWHDNLLPIQEMERELSEVLLDLHRISELKKQETTKALSEREQRKLDRLIRKQPVIRLKKLIEMFNVSASWWDQDDFHAKAKAFTDAAKQCEQILVEFRYQCPELCPNLSDTM